MEELERSHRIVKAGVERLLSAADKAERDILEVLLKSLKGYPTKGGRFVWDKSNLILLGRLRPELERALAKADFEASMLRYFDDFDKIGQNIAQVHKKVNQVRVSKKELEVEKAAIIEETLKGLVQANINQTYLIPVKQGLYNKIRFGATVTETERYLRQAIAGTEQEGVIGRWVGQVARDSANQYEGTINQKVKEEYGFEHWEYVGGIVEHSRKQCIRWVEMGTIADEDLDEEIAWAYANGQGMVPGTDRSTFAIYRGGYNCLHTAYPVK